MQQFNYPCAKISRTNETRHIKLHEMCKCKCRLDASVCNNKQRWNNNKCRCKCKELIDKGVCDREYIWDPSNCECECDKSCDIGEYWDYKNCKCRKTSRGFKGFKTKRTTKSIADKSDNSPSISKEIYDELIEERMGEILEMSREIKYDKLVYDFKGPTSSINFTKFGGPVYTYNQLKNGDKTLQQVEKEQEDFKIDLNEIASGNPKHKSDSHLYTIKNVKSLYSSRQKNIDLLNDMQKLNLNQFIDQNKMKEQGQDLKY